MFNTDKPINNLREDKLGRSSFASQMAEAIWSFKTEDSYAISLQGKWGCGKTSVLNMVVEEIKRLSKESDEKNKVVIVQFNPWNFTDTGQLINQFFLTINKELNLNNKDEKAKKVGLAIESYSSALEYTEYIPCIGKYLKLIPKLVGAYGRLKKEAAKSKLNDVAYRKGEVEKALSELDSKILIVIDDIDRLPNEQICLIFQLVNAVAGFLNTIYLLSFDKRIVSRALGDVQGCNGEEYLEKIIQIPFDVPPLNLSKLHNILREKLNAINELASSEEFDKKRWAYVFNSCLSPFINTLRDVNRYCNVFSFMYAAVKEEVDFIDMAGISALKIFAFPIYEWIRNNKYTLVGGNDKKSVSNNELEKQNEEMLKEFKEIYPSPEVMLSALNSLFPEISLRFRYLSESITSSTLHQQMRIAAESKFELYFTLSLEDIKLSRKEIDNSFYDMNESQLRSYINTLEERNLYNDYLKEIEYNISRIPEERIELFLSLLVFKSGRISDEQSLLRGADIRNFDIKTIINMLFKMDCKDKRYNIILKMFSKSDFLSFQSLSHFFYNTKLLSAGGEETSEMHEEKLIKFEHLSELKRVFIQRIRGFLETTNLFDWKEVRTVSNLWKNYEEETYNEYLEKFFSEPSSIPKYLSFIRGVWRESGKIKEYCFVDRTYRKFISDSEIAEVLNRIRLKSFFWSLENSEIESSAAFIIITEHLSSGKMNEMESVDISEINKLIDKWRREFEEQEV